MAEHGKSVTTDLKCRNHLNKFFMEDSIDDDNSAVRLSPKMMDKLQLFCGDAVKLKGKKRRETICIAISDDTCQDDRIRANLAVQNNLRVHAGNIISVQGCQEVKHGTHIHILPFDDTVKDITGDILKEYLQPYFRDALRPVCVGDTFIVRTTMRDAIEFKVIKTEPSPYCIVVPETVIDCEGEPVQRETQEAWTDGIDFDDIGGLDDVKQKLKEFIQCSIEHQEIYLKFGIEPSKGVLLYGPPGCGKTMFRRALANECDINVISTNSVELFCMSSDTIEDNVRNIFDKTRQSAPCILFIDDLDCICKYNSNVASGHVQVDRLVNQILTEIDGLSVKTKVFIVGTTNRPDRIDRTILRPGRLDQLIYVPLPDEKSRLAILKIALQKVSVATNVDLIFLAQILNGFSGADIVEFCQGACKSAIREMIEKELEMEQSNSPSDMKVEIRRDHFEQVMKAIPRCCPGTNDIHKYEMFAQMWQPTYRFDSSFPMPVNTQNNNEAGGVQQGSNVYTDDDDLYA